MKSLKIVDRLDDDHRNDHRPQQRQNDLEEEPQRPGTIHDCRLVELARDRRDEGAEQKDRERQPVGDLDQDQAVQRLEQVEALQHPDRRHDRRRDDQPGEHEEIHDRRPARRPALQDEPTIAPKTTSRVTLTTVRMIELMKAVISM